MSRVPDRTNMIVDAGVPVCYTSMFVSLYSSSCSVTITTRRERHYHYYGTNMNHSSYDYYGYDSSALCIMYLWYNSIVVIV